MDRGPDQGYFPETAKSLFIVDNPEEKEAEKREFGRLGLNINCVYVGHYLEAYLVPMEELE